MGREADPSEEMELKFICRFDSPAQKKYFTEDSYVGGFDGTVVGAHLALQFERMVKLALITTENPFVIDPMVYMFARKRENMMKDKERDDGSTEKVLKKSYEKLAVACGNEVKRIVLEEKRRIQVSDFLKEGNWNESLLIDLVRNVVELQMNLIPPGQKKFPDDIVELMDADELESLQKAGKVLALVPPYFYASSVKDDWYKITLECAKKGKEYKGSYKICPLLCLSKEVLQDKESWVSIAQDLLDNEFKRVLIWFSDLNEFREDSKVLKNLREFTDSLSKKLKVYSAYGGYFFALLNHFGVEGFSQSMCYGESKNVDKAPGIGGVPQRYYVPFLHRKVLVEDARSFYGSFPKRICKCNSCVSIRGVVEEEGHNLAERPSDYVDRFFSLLTTDDAIGHFLQCRKEELDKILTSNLNEVLDSLKGDLEFCQESNSSLYRGFSTSHLSNWIKVLED